MKPMTSDEVETLLRRGGFSLHSSNGSHFKWVNAKTRRHAIVPHHGGRVIPQGTLLVIFRQAGIPPPKR